MPDQPTPATAKSWGALFRKDPMLYVALFLLVIIFVQRNDNTKKDERIIKLEEERYTTERQRTQEANVRTGKVFDALRAPGNAIPDYGNNWDSTRDSANRNGPN